MEFSPKICKKRRKKQVHFIRDSFDGSSSVSSSSGSDFRPFNCQRKKKKETNYSKRNFLTKLFEKKKLKEKSLSKKVKTPFHRKLYRTCWPIDLGKATKIKKKPQEKKREKPSHRSLARRKFLNPKFISTKSKRKYTTPPISCSEIEFLEDESFSEVYHCKNTKHLVFEHVTPQMLMSVLQDPEHLKYGATISMIIKKLRTLSMNLNPSLHQLREEILQKLMCAVKLGLVTENYGFYKIPNNIRDDRLSRKKFNDVWELWNRRMTKIRT